jgi:hypothetical protein
MKNSLIQSASVHGLLIGLALVILSLIDWAFGFYGQNVGLSLLHYVIIIGGLLWCGFAYRKQCGGYASFGGVFIYSLMVAIFYAFIASVFSVLLTQVIAPDYVERLMAITEDKYYELGLSSQQIDKMIDFSSQLMQPMILFLSGLFGTILSSLIIALITSAIVKKNNPNPFGVAR